MKFCTLLICCVLMVQNVAAIKSFSAKLYEEVKKSQPRNFVLSPLSLTNALAMVGLGAKGETAQEIWQSLDYKNNTDLINAQSELISSLKNISSRNSGVKFVTADRIYAKYRLRVKDQYKNEVERLGGEIKTVDFGKSEAAARKINSWVQEKTEGKIEKLVDASALNSQTSLLVLNSIYFKGSWENKFDNSSTRKTPFFVNASCSVNVEMMTQKNKFQLSDLKDAEAQVILLPYKGERLSMMIYLPNGREENSLETLENWLENQSPFDIQNQHLSNSFIGDVSVSLPKFQIRSSLDLNEPLKNLGLGKMFDQSAANFSGIFHSSGNFFVSKVSQETFIEVNEEGTEAAAVTGFKLEATSFSPTPEFIANRPFLFQIVDSTTRTVFFSGRVKNPLDSGSGSGSGESSVSTGQTEEPSCANPKKVESTTRKSNTSTSTNIGTAGNKTNNSCEGNQKLDVGEMLIQFLNLLSSPNSTAEFKKNLTTRVLGLETFLAGRAAEKAQVVKSNQELMKTVEDLKSSVKELKSRNRQTPCLCNHGNMTKTIGVTTETTTRREEDQEHFPSFLPATAWGYENFTDLSGKSDSKPWDYNSTLNGPCLDFKQTALLMYFYGPSCVALYGARNCSGDKFQLDTETSLFERRMAFKFGTQKPTKSIGVCS